MAVRRMFHGDILMSDSFLSLPFRAQMLYVQLSMAADDDGFCNRAEGISRVIGARRSDLSLLTEKRFLLQFGSVVVIKHWRLANSLKNDRLKALSYPEIAEKLYIKKNRVYTDHPCEGAVNLRELREESWNPSGIPGKEKVGEDREREDKKEENKKEENLEQGSIEEDPDSAAAARESLQKMEGALGKGVLLMSQTQMDDLLDRMGLDCFDYYTDKLSGFILKNDAKVKNHYETILKWWKEDKQV